MAATYTLLGTKTATDSSTYTFPNSLTDPNVVLDFTLNVPNKPTWIRAGYVKAVSTTALGELAGKSQLVIFGRQELVLNVPQYPYRLQFKPSSYITAWKCDLYDSIPDFDYPTLSTNSGLTVEFLKSRTGDELSLLTALFPGSPWVYPPPSNGFAVFGQGYQDIRYRVKDGRVEIQGTMYKFGTTAGETLLFTLPQNARPSGLLSLPLSGSWNNTSSNFRVDVKPNGEVVYVQFAAKAGVSYILLSCHFSL